MNPHCVFKVINAYGYGDKFNASGTYCQRQARSESGPRLNSLKRTATPDQPSREPQSVATEPQTAAARRQCFIAPHRLHVTKTRDSY